MNPSNMEPVVEDDSLSLPDLEEMDGSSEEDEYDEDEYEGAEVNCMFHENRHPRVDAAMDGNGDENFDLRLNVEIEIEVDNDHYQEHYGNMDREMFVLAPGFLMPFMGHYVYQDLDARSFASGWSQETMTYSEVANLSDFSSDEEHLYE